MDKKSVKKVAEYWRKTAEHDFDVMMTLFKNKRYDYSLFFGHIVLEKILKSLVVEHTGKHAPYIHDLARLYEITGMGILSEEERVLLKEVNNFNLQCRYPDYKLKFYKTCTKIFTKNYLDKIIKLYKTLCKAKK